MHLPGPSYAASLLSLARGESKECDKEILSKIVNPAQHTKECLDAPYPLVVVQFTQAVLSELNTKTGLIKEVMRKINIHSGYNSSLLDIITRKRDTRYSGSVSNQRRVDALGG